VPPLVKRCSDFTGLDDAKMRQLVADRERREAESVAAMQEWFAAPHPSEPQQHPSVRDEE
jgi:hypothetical protein